ncbi:MAG: hypothetical protein ABIF11_06700 [Nitrospirota bacterium]
MNLVSNALIDFDNLGQDVCNLTGYEHPTRPTFPEGILPAKRFRGGYEWVISPDSSTGIKRRRIFSDCLVIHHKFRPYLKNEDYAGLIIEETNASSVDGFFPAVDLTELSSSKENGSDIDRLTFISERVKEIFCDGESEIFKAGMDSIFSQRLNLMINYSGVLTLKALNDLLSNRQTNIELLSETMRTVGRNADIKTKNLRFRFLIEGLNHTSAIIRDSASLGLCDMEDPHAIPYLEDAISREKYDSLKNDYKQIIEDLGAC